MIDVLMIAARRLSIPPSLAITSGDCGIDENGWLVANMSRSSNGSCRVETIDVFFDVKSVSSSVLVLSASTSASMSVVLKLVDPDTGEVIDASTMLVSGGEAFGKWIEKTVSLVLDEPARYAKVVVEFEWSGGVILARAKRLVDVIDMYAEMSVLSEDYIVNTLGEAIDGFSERYRFARFLLGRNHYIVPCSVEYAGKQYFLYRVDSPTGLLLDNESVNEQCATRGYVEVDYNGVIKPIYVYQKGRKWAYISEEISAGLSTGLESSSFGGRIESSIVALVSETISAKKRVAPRLVETISASIDSGLVYYRGYRAPSDQLSLSDALQFTVTRGISSEISVAVTEAVTASHRRLVSLSETLSASLDSLVATYAGRILVDQLSLSDTVSTRVTRFISSSITTSVSETVSAEKAILVQLAETLSASLDTSISTKAGVSLSESLSLSDTVSTKRIVRISSSITSTVSEQLSIRKTVSVKLSETVTANLSSSLSTGR